MDSVIPTGRPRLWGAARWAKIAARAACAGGCLFFLKGFSLFG